jgi:hypothetical protein
MTLFIFQAEYTVGTDHSAALRSVEKHFQQGSAERGTF